MRFYIVIFSFAGEIHSLVSKMEPAFVPGKSSGTMISLALVVRTTQGFVVVYYSSLSTSSILIISLVGNSLAFIQDYHFLSSLFDLLLLS